MFCQIPKLENRWKILLKLSPVFKVIFGARLYLVFKFHIKIVKLEVGFDSMAFVLREVVLFFFTLLFEKKLEPVDQEILGETQFLFWCLSNVENALDFALEFIIEQVWIYDFEHHMPRVFFDVAAESMF